MLFEEPLGVAVEEHFADDLVRGVVLTDALIGTFADAHDHHARRQSAGADAERRQARPRARGLHWHHEGQGRLLHADDAAGVVRLVHMPGGRGSPPLHTLDR